MVTLTPGDILAAGTCRLPQTTYSGLHQLLLVAPSGATVASVTGGCNASADGGVYLTYMQPFVRRRGLLASSSTTYTLVLFCHVSSPSCTGAGAYSITRAPPPPSPPPSPPLVPATVSFSLCIVGYNASDLTSTAPNSTAALAAAGIAAWLASVNCTQAAVTVSQPTAGCSGSQAVLQVTVSVLVATDTADADAAAILAIRGLGSTPSAPAALLAELQAAGLTAASSAALPVVVGSGTLSSLVTAQVATTLAATSLPPPAARQSVQAQDAPPPPPPWPPALGAPPDANGGAGGAINRHYYSTASDEQTVTVTSGVVASLTGLAALCIIGQAVVHAWVGAHLRRTAVTVALLVQGHIFEEDMAACKKSASGRLRVSRTGAHADAPLGKTCEAPAAAEAVSEVLRAAAELFGSVQGVRAPKNVVLRPLLKEALPLLDVPTDKKAAPPKPVHPARRLGMQIAAELRWQYRETRALVQAIARWVAHCGSVPGAGQVMTLMPTDTPVVALAAQDEDHPSAGLAARLLQPGSAPTCVLVQVTWHFGHGAGGQDAASVWRSHLREAASLSELEASVSASLRGVADETELLGVGCVVLALLDDAPHVQLDKKRGQELQGRLASTVGARLDAIAAESGDTGKDPLRVVFDSFDDNGSGCLDAGELQSALRLLGVTLPLQEAEHLVKQLDTDGNGDVSFDEFASWWDATTASSLAAMAEVVSDRLAALETVEESIRGGSDAITRVFNSLDADGSGTLDSEELRTALGQLGVTMSPREATSLLARLDTDGSGGVSLDEFTAWWNATMASSVDAVRNYGVALAVAQRLLLIRLVGGADDAWRVHARVTTITAGVALRCQAVGSGHDELSAADDDKTTPRLERLLSMVNTLPSDDSPPRPPTGRLSSSPADRVVRFSVGSFDSALATEDEDGSPPQGGLAGLSRRYRVLGHRFSDPGLATALVASVRQAAAEAVGVSPAVDIRQLQREALLGAHGGVLLSDDDLVAAMLADASLQGLLARGIAKALRQLGARVLLMARRAGHTLRRLVHCAPRDTMLHAKCFRQLDASSWADTHGESRGGQSHPTIAAVCELQWRFPRRQTAAAQTFLEYLHSEVGVADLERNIRRALQAADPQLFSSVTPPTDVCVALLDAHLLTKADATVDAAKSLRGAAAQEAAIRQSLAQRRQGAQARRVAILQQMCVQQKDGQLAGSPGHDGGDGQYASPPAAAIQWTMGGGSDSDEPAEARRSSFQDFEDFADPELSEWQDWDERLELQ